ncbi:hypothetical protein NL676_014439 [Syzygium grande]|nr:hypothetical protein NL676_014439 [Syzygium grande]
MCHLLDDVYRGITYTTGPGISKDVTNTSEDVPHGGLGERIPPDGRAIWVSRKSFRDVWRGQGHRGGVPETDDGSESSQGGEVDRRSWSHGHARQAP